MVAKGSISIRGACEDPERGEQTREGKTLTYTRLPFDQFQTLLSSFTKLLLAVLLLILLPASAERETSRAGRQRWRGGAIRGTVVRTMVRGESDPIPARKGVQKESRELTAGSETERQRSLDDIAF